MNSSLTPDLGAFSGKSFGAYAVSNPRSKQLAGIRLSLGPEPTGLESEIRNERLWPVWIHGIAVLFCFGVRRFK
jgi:hypothetical protein